MELVSSRGLQRCSCCMREEVGEYHSNGSRRPIADAGGEESEIDLQYKCRDCRELSEEYDINIATYPVCNRNDFDKGIVIEKVLFVRNNLPQEEDDDHRYIITTTDPANIEYLVSWRGLEPKMNSWINQGELLSLLFHPRSNEKRVLIDYFNSMMYRNMVDAAWRDAEFQMSSVITEEHQGMFNDIKYTKVVYKFTNGKPFGVTQYYGLLTENELSYFEQRCDYLEQNEDTLKPQTIDKTKDLSRTKYFLGYRYDYGNATRGKQPYLHDDVDDFHHPFTDWIPELISMMKERNVVANVATEKTDHPFEINCGVLNVYHRPGAGLGVHMDSIALFHRPIYSVRLFSRSVLSFGCRGPGMIDRKVAVPQPRGSITVLDGFAANCTMHCIRPADIRGKSASLILRDVKLDMVTKDPPTTKSITTHSNLSPSVISPKPKKVLTPTDPNRQRPAKPKTRKTRKVLFNNEPENQLDGETPSPKPKKPRKTKQAAPPPTSGIISTTSTSKDASPPPPILSSPITPPENQPLSAPQVTPQVETVTTGRPRRERRVNVDFENFPFIRW